MVFAAQDVHLRLDLTVGHRQLAGQALAERHPVGQRQQRIGIEQFVEQLRMAREIVGRPARGMQRVGHTRHGLRILGQQ